jgi:hypothetical protein
VFLANAHTFTYFIFLITFLTCACSGVYSGWLFFLRSGEPTIPLGMKPPITHSLIHIVVYRSGYRNTMNLIDFTKIPTGAGDAEGMSLASPPPSESLTREDADNILDEEDGMDSTDEYGDCADASVHDRAANKRSLADRSMEDASAPGPSLPPIYYSILKKKTSKRVVRHLDGGAYQEVDSTYLGASISSLEQVGSFANKGDKRHNRTTHRHDHSKLRNISTSFDPCKLICTTCPGEHTVLRRSIEGNDVGMDNPPVFVLTDQNFPPMVPAGGEGECLKIIQVENSTLVELVEVFLGITRGFDVPAGTVILLASASHAAAVGTADYASDFVRASGMLRGTFAGDINVLHGVPFLIGGTKSTTAIRALAEIGQWVQCTSVGIDEISATRKAFASSLRTNTSTPAQHCIIRLPATQTNSERVPFVVTGFDNLKTAVEPLGEDEEKSLLTLLLEELNSLYPVNLDTDVVCDRFMEDEVFDDSSMDRTDLVLIGASHLANISKHFDLEKWKVCDLTRPGMRVNKDTVEAIVAAVTGTAAAVDWTTAVVVLQLFDNSVYLVGTPGGEKHLPRRDRHGAYHIDGDLTVADKSAVKNLVTMLMPLFKVLESSRKIVLTPLARYWVGPCCSDASHHTNYKTGSYLPALGGAVHGLRDNIRDSLFTRHVSNFRVLCPNKMIGVGQCSQDPSDDEAARSAALWGNDPVHPSAAAYRCMADQLEKDMLNSEARYTNPAKHHAQKRPRVDLSLGRDDWVAGCSAAAPRRDAPPSRGSMPRRGDAGPRAGTKARGRGNLSSRGSF